MGKKANRTNCYSRRYPIRSWFTENKIWKNNEKNFKKNSANEPDNLGDTTTLADPSVVTSLVENRQNKG